MKLSYLLSLGVIGIAIAGFHYSANSQSLREQYEKQQAQEIIKRDVENNKLQNLVQNSKYFPCGSVEQGIAGAPKGDFSQRTYIDETNKIYVIDPMNRTIDYVGKIGQNYTIEEITGYSGNFGKYKMRVIMNYRTPSPAAGVQVLGGQITRIFEACNISDSIRLYNAAYRLR